MMPKLRYSDDTFSALCSILYSTLTFLSSPSLSSPLYSSISYPPPSFPPPPPTPRCPSKAECLWGVFIGLISGRWRSLGGAGDKAAKAGNAIYQTSHKPSQASTRARSEGGGTWRKKKATTLHLHPDIRGAQWQAGWHALDSFCK